MDENFKNLEILAKIGMIEDKKENWLCTNGQTTIAHIAAEHGRLPRNFDVNYPDIWELVDSNNRSVKDIAVENGYNLYQ